MTAYTMKQISASYYSITSSGKKVGFITVCPKGFVARIGTYCEVATTKQRAFEIVVAKSCGFSTPEALSTYNAKVRQQNILIRQKTRYAADQLLSHNNIDPMLELIKNCNNPKL